MLSIHRCPFVFSKRVHSFSDEDSIDTPIYVCDTESGVALLGMDVLKLCNFSQWHEWEKDEHSVYFEIELLGDEAFL